MKTQWWATRGGGAYESGWPTRATTQRLETTATPKLRDAKLDGHNGNSRARLPSNATIVAPSTEGWCAGLVAVARGQLDGFLAEGCQLWDHAPWTLIVEEAGGAFTNTAGSHRPERGGGLYSNAFIHDELVATLGYRRTELCQS